MNCRSILVAALALVLLSGCKASNNGAKSPTPPPPTASAAPTTSRTPPPLPPTPARTPVGTSGPRVGVAGQVVISATGFAPAEITVRAGRPVTFVNADSVPHRVVSATTGTFDTGEIPPGSSAPVTVNDTGFTDFHDAATPSRTGTITTVP